MADVAFEQWQHNPADLALLSSWVAGKQQQSQQASAIEQLLPITAAPLQDAVAAGVYTALITLQLELGRIQQANDWVNRLGEVDRESFRAPYFRGLILQRLHRLEAAKGYFREAIKRDRTRVDAWKALLTCCSLTRDFGLGLAVIQQARALPWSPQWRRLWPYRQGCIYQQMANYSLALVSFAEVILDCAANGIPRQTVSMPAALSQVPPEAPQAALSDAIRLLENQGLQPFPTAGTLLGWWREGRFLAHDKDIDIMLPPGSDWQKAFKALSEAPEFGLAPNEMGYSNFQSFFHRETRLVVDLSCHELRDDGQIGCVWRIPRVPEEQLRRTKQSAYHLVRDQWLGREFWRPENPDHFLTELYGDWRTPMVNFDTVMSGHHLQGFPDAVRCYGYNRLAFALSEGNRDKGLAYVAQILSKDPLDPVANHINSIMAKSRGDVRG